ncbi:MAG: hypothetical protein II821_03080 [Treponema sp.]|jgi:hypothetical protein|nr:hypothetical protein [Treponema sp.]
MWSEELQNLTREQAYGGAMMKKLDGDSGMLSGRGPNGITIVAVEFKNYMPVPVDKIIARYKNVEEMIADGWAID